MKRLCAGLVLIGCAAVLAGCTSKPNPTAPPTAGPGEPAAETVQRPPLAPEIRYLDPLAEREGYGGSSPAVVVQGYPLVHTRQLLPLDQAGQLVGEGSAEQQTEQVLANLAAVLESAGSGLDRLVRLNVYADSAATAQQVREQLVVRLPSGARPALTVVETPLRQAGAVVALDAVATAEPENAPSGRLRVQTLSGEDGYADAAVLPPGGAVYLSGQPERGQLGEATGKSLSTLLQMLQGLGLGAEQIVQLKVFVQPASASGEAAAEIKRLFGEELVPPLVFVEWIASAPVEIELIAELPPAAAGQELLRHYNPADVKPSPTFSRAALVQTGRQIYISGLSARAAGDGETQVRDVFAQLEEILAATGSDLRHLAKATYYVSDEDASTKLNELRPEYFDPQRPPAASKATVHGVGVADRGLSMDMIAVPAGGGS